MSTSPCEGVPCSFSWDCTAQNYDNRSIDVKEMLLPKCSISLEFKFSFGMVTVAEFIVDELTLSQWRGEFLSVKLCPFISVFCFLGLFFIVPMTSCIPIILHPQNIILAFTETIWSSWKLCSLIYLYSWVICPHAIFVICKRPC